MTTSGHHNKVNPHVIIEADDGSYFMTGFFAINNNAARLLIFKFSCDGDFLYLNEVEAADIEDHYISGMDGKRTSDGGFVIFGVEGKYGTVNGYSQILFLKFSSAGIVEEYYPYVIDGGNEYSNTYLSANSFYETNTSYVVCGSLSFSLQSLIVVLEISKINFSDVRWMKSIGKTNLAKTSSCMDVMENKYNPNEVYVVGRSNDFQLLNFSEIAVFAKVSNNKRLCCNNSMVRRNYRKLFKRGHDIKGMNSNPHNVTMTNVNVTDLSVFGDEIYDISKGIDFYEACNGNNIESSSIFNVPKNFVIRKNCKKMEKNKNILDFQINVPDYYFTSLCFGDSQFDVRPLHHNYEELKLYFTYEGEMVNDLRQLKIKNTENGRLNNLF